MFLRNLVHLGLEKFYQNPLAKPPCQNQNIPDELLKHPNGAKEITGLKIQFPQKADLSVAAQSLMENHICELRSGDSFLMEMTLDHGVQNKSVLLPFEAAVRIRY